MHALDVSEHPRLTKDQKREMGDRVRQARDRAKLTQRRLADAAGVQSQQVWRIEHDGTMPEADTLVLIAHALSVTPEWLLWGGERREPDETGISVHVRKVVDAWHAQKRAGIVKPQHLAALRELRPSMGYRLTERQVEAAWRDMVDTDELGADVREPPARREGQRDVAEVDAARRKPRR